MFQTTTFDLHLEILQNLHLKPFKDLKILSSDFMDNPSPNLYKINNSFELGIPLPPDPTKHSSLRRSPMQAISTFT